MIKKLFQEDEFPVSLDTETRELVCIGFCMQCPLYLNYGEKLKSIEDCKAIIEKA